MQSINSSRVFITLLKTGIIIGLLAAAATKQQYSYYTFIRWLVTIGFVYLAYYSYSRKQIGLLIFFAATAILFNPFKPFILQKKTWHLIDYIIAAILFITIVSDWIQTNKKH